MYSLQCTLYSGWQWSGVSVSHWRLPNRTNERKSRTAVLYTPVVTSCLRIGIACVFSRRPSPTRFVVLRFFFFTFTRATSSSSISISGGTRKALRVAHSRAKQSQVEMRNLRQASTLFPFPLLCFPFIRLSITRLRQGRLDKSPLQLPVTGSPFDLST